MDKLTLRLPDGGDEARVWAYRQAFLDRGERVHGSRGLGECESYAVWFQRFGDEIPSGLVPSTTWLAIRESDGALVGFADIRHSLNEHFLNYSGHIGYSVHPAERRKGYGSEILRLALEYCRDKLGLDRALVTCNKSNEASRRTILSRGGVLEDEREREGALIQRYWIAL